MIPALESGADDTVGAGLDDGDVGCAGVRRVDIDSHGDDLAGSVGVHLGVVGKWYTLALPDLAVGLGALHVLNGTLDIAEVIGVLVVEDLLSTSSCEARTRKTRLRASDIAVGSDGGDEARKCDSRVRFHSCGGLCCRRGS